MYGKSIRTLCGLVILAVMLTLVSTTGAVYAQVDNPQLEQSCGLDIALVLDSSGSISPSNYNLMRGAFVNFVDVLLPQTPTEFSVVEFGTYANVRLDFSNDRNTIVDAINQNRPYDITYSTNWYEGLTETHNLFPNRNNQPDLIIFASDGDPNEPYDSTYPYDPDYPLNIAIEAADAIKTDGIRIMTIGIGYSVNTDNLAAISSPDAVMTSDFDDLADDLEQLSSELCGSSISVHKIIDQDGQLNTVNDQTNGAGWNFAATATAGSLNATSGDTDENGYTVFEVDLNTPSVPATVEIIETVQTGFSLVSATCKDQDDNLVGTLQENSMVGLTVESFDIISCDFYNTPSIGTITFEKIIADGDSTPEDWEFTVNGQTVPHNGQITLGGGQYTVTENGGTYNDNYELADASGACQVENDEIVLTVTENGGTCTVTNKQKLPSITIIKDASPNGNTIFDFISTIPDNINFSLVDDGVSDSNQVVFTDLTPGEVYTITEIIPDMWNLENVSCKIEETGEDADYDIIYTGGDDNLSTMSMPSSPPEKEPIGVEVLLYESVVCTFENDRPKSQTLYSISAIARDDLDLIEVNWTTLREVGTKGFNLFRSTSPNGPFVQINNDLIPAQGDSSSGSSYTYLDTDVEVGITYYYYTQEMEIDDTLINHNDEPWKIVSATLQAAVPPGIYLPIIYKS